MLSFKPSNASVDHEQSHLTSQISSTPKNLYDKIVPHFLWWSPCNRICRIHWENRMRFNRLQHSTRRLFPVCQDWGGFTDTKEHMCKSFHPSHSWHWLASLVNFLTALPAGNDSYQNVCNSESGWCWARKWRCSWIQGPALCHRGERNWSFSFFHMSCLEGAHIHFLS